MFQSLLTARTDADFAAAMARVREAYLTGGAGFGGETLPLPFGKLFKEHFDVKKDEDAPISDENRKWQGNLNHTCNVVAAMAHACGHTRMAWGSARPISAANSAC